MRRTLELSLKASGWVRRMPACSVSKPILAGIVPSIVSREDKMTIIVALLAAFLIGFGLLAETAPTLDYMADER